MKIRTMTIGGALTALLVAGTVGAETTAPQLNVTVEPAAPTLLESAGLTVSDLQPAATTTSGEQLYRASSPDVSCVTDRRGGGHCAPTKDLDKGLGFGGELCQPDLDPGLVRITAVVPPETRRVTLKLDSGQTVSQAPTNSTVGFEIPRVVAARPVRAILSSALGFRTVDVPSPPLDPSAPCDDTSR